MAPAVLLVANPLYPVSDTRTVRRLLEQNEELWNQVELCPV